MKYVRLFELTDEYMVLDMLTDGGSPVVYAQNIHTKVKFTFEVSARHLKIKKGNVYVFEVFTLDALNTLRTDVMNGPIRVSTSMFIRQALLINQSSNEGSLVIQ